LPKSKPSKSNKPKDGECWEDTYKKEVRDKKNMRRSYNSLNNLKHLVQKDKEEDFMLGINRKVEDDIKEKRND